MRLSVLQRYILKMSFHGKHGKISKKAIQEFYIRKNISKESIIHDITKSVERLIARDLLIGFGKKTAYKWMIKEIQLTSKGRSAVKELFGKQRVLPLRIKK